MSVYSHTAEFSVVIMVLVAIIVYYVMDALARLYPTWPPGDDQ